MLAVCAATMGRGGENKALETWKEPTGLYGFVGH